MAVSKSGPMFFKAINYEGETKDKHFIADLFINTIQDIGPQKVVQVICDAPNSGCPLTTRQPVENLYVSYYETHT